MTYVCSNDGHVIQLEKLRSGHPEKQCAFNIGTSYLILHGVVN